MASTRLKAAKDGHAYYEIQIFDDGTRRYSRWYIPKGWSRRSIEQGLKRPSGNMNQRSMQGKHPPGRNAKNWRQRNRGKPP